MPQAVQTLVGRAQLSLNDLLSHVHSGIAKVEAATGLSQKFNSLLEKVHYLFDKAVHQAEEVETPVELVKTGFEFGTLIHKIEHLSHKAVKSITAAAQPLQLLALAAEVQKVREKVLGAMHQGLEEIKTVETAVLGFSVVSKICNILAWIQQLGLFSHAKHSAAHGGRMTTIGSFSYLGSAILELVDEIRQQTSTLKVGKAFLNSIGALLGVVLIYTVSVKLHVLLLILTLASLLLSFATKEKEPEHHKYVTKDHESVELPSSPKEFELPEIQTA